MTIVAVWELPFQDRFAEDRSDMTKKSLSFSLTPSCKFTIVIT